MAKLKIAITGPESTGKSTLCKALSKTYNTEFIPEVARSYIDQLNRPYNYDDLLEIAKLQKQQADIINNNHPSIIFSDTSMMTLELWSMDKFKKCDQWIIDQVQNERFDLYLLCNIDLPWTYDEQREDPNRRSELFDVHKAYLNKYNFRYSIISGDEKDRLQNAIKAIELFKSEN